MAGALAESVTLAGGRSGAYLAESGSNPDVELLYDINGLAKDAPSWFDDIMTFVGEYGLLLATVLMVLWCWWGARRRGGEDAAASVAALVWVPLAAGVAVLVNVPIRNFVERPRPFLDHDGLEVLIDGKNDFSFVSDHATLTMAMGVALFLANRKWGLVGLVFGLLGGVLRIYMGVHYPTDVIGGFALGTAVALLLSPVAMALLTPVVKAVERSPRVGWLVRARGARGRAEVVAGASVEPPAGQGQRDLAA
ncbi:phosphatase PAP2 family protein [Streptomyces ruber]|uniref:Phosphatase PAP2 family protein n=2 Tax=Streptomyces TaxID=1883 RepID=A0A918BTB1_9ACTN|nr:phosphatase PAP2 family protein [Streptomyces ruber]GGQ90038.1 phosphatase PAP2 family protein [Streptomyces ruber]